MKRKAVKAAVTDEKDLNNISIFQFKETLIFRTECNDITIRVKQPSGIEVSVPAHSAILWHIPYFRAIFDKNPVIFGTPYSIQLDISLQTLFCLFTTVYPGEGRVVYPDLVTLPHWQRSLNEVKLFRWQKAEDLILHNIWSTMKGDDIISLEPHTVANYLDLSAHFLHEKAIWSRLFSYIGIWHNSEVLSLLQASAVHRICTVPSSPPINGLATCMQTSQKISLLFTWLDLHPGAEKEDITLLLGTLDQIRKTSTLNYSDIKPFVTTKSLPLAHYLISTGLSALKPGPVSVPFPQLASPGSLPAVRVGYVANPIPPTG